MNPQHVQKLVVDALDNKFVREGLEKGIPAEATRQELAENRRVAHLYENLRAAGYTDEQVSVLWEGKSTQEILAESNPKEAVTRANSRGVKQSTVLEKTS